MGKRESPLFNIVSSFQFSRVHNPSFFHSPATTMATTQIDTIMEERDELMVSSNLTQHHHPTRRIVPFLKPSATSTDNVQPFSFNQSSVHEISPLKVSFNGWRNPQKEWKAWVESMRSLHKSTWIKVGIHHAVLNSTYEIIKNEDLILGFVEKWCHRTKTFVFVWGEATITLEDMMILGGYSVLGHSVLHSIENAESETILAKLDDARAELSRSRFKKAVQFQWMKRFKDSGSEIEHEAFLVYWLSRFVFASSYSTVSRNVFTIAVHLARGNKLAIAPAVLAGLYRDLSLLKAKIVGSNNLGSDETTVTVWSPFQLVQIWIIERFPKLRPNPKIVPNIIDHNPSNPRFARWEKMKLHIEKVTSFVNCGLQDFVWQPYDTNANGNSRLGQEMWVVVNDCLDEELESWVRCIRVSELVGIDTSCIQQYLPHRVAMQFGMNQDTPADVPRANVTSEIAWRFYSRPFKDVKFYLPSRFSEQYVTARYLEWWKKSTGVCSLSANPMGDNETDNLVKDESGTEGSQESIGIDEVDAMGLELEARISKLEDIFAYLKAKKKQGDPYTTETGHTQ